MTREEMMLRQEMASVATEAADSLYRLAEIATGRTDGGGYVPWTLDAPDGPLIGYVDENNQQHWLGEHTHREAPAGWRVLYVKR